MFKRMMVLGAMASALVFTGCRDRSEDAVMDRTAVPPSTTMPATGGSGASDYSTSGSTNLEDTTQSQDIEDGADLNTGGTGGAGTVTPVEPDTGTNVDGTGGSGAMDSDSFKDDSRGDLHNIPPASDMSGTGGAGAMDDAANTSHQGSSMEHTDSTK
jgi:hypothetical protein